MPNSMTNNPQAASDEKILNAALEAGFRCHFAGIYHPLGHPRMNEHMARFAVHPACCECGRLYPEMVFEPAIRDFCDANYTTRCCDAGTYDWKFVVGTRKGKVNLTVRSRVAAVQRRGVWAALSM